MPRGCDVYSQSKIGGEYLKVTLLSGADYPKFGERRQSDIIDRLAIEAACKIRSLLLSDLRYDALSLEQSIGVLVGRAEHLVSYSRPRDHAGSWMTARRQQVVEDMIESRLDGKLTVQELADVLGLSSGFFSRAFKAAVGKSPYDFIIDRRIARARALMDTVRWDLSEIARASGFASHAHMTATFGQRLGVNPSQLRRYKPTSPDADLHPDV